MKEQQGHVVLNHLTGEIQPGVKMNSVLPKLENSSFFSKPGLEILLPLHKNMEVKCVGTCVFKQLLGNTPLCLSLSGIVVCDNQYSI